MEGLNLSKDFKTGWKESIDNPDKGVSFIGGLVSVLGLLVSEENDERLAGSQLVIDLLRRH